MLDVLGAFDSLLLIFLLWGPPGQEVNSFQCEKLAVAGEGKLSLIAQHPFHVQQIL